MKIVFVFGIALITFLLSPSFAQAPLKPPEGVFAFPFENAGISAYLKSDRPIRITDAVTRVFYRVVNAGENYIVGTVEIEHLFGKVYPHVYLDTDGWIVAFFLATQPPALIMNWSGDRNNPTAVIKTTLEAALEKVTTAARVSFVQPTFYDFRYPAANTMLVLLSLLREPGEKVMYVKLPGHYKLFSVSYYHYGCNLCHYYERGDFIARLEINGTLHSDLRGRDVIKEKVIEIPVRDFPVDELHEIYITYEPNRDCGSSGVVVVLIYAAP